MPQFLLLSARQTLPDFFLKNQCFFVPHGLVELEPHQDQSSTIGGLSTIAARIGYHFCSSSQLRADAIESDESVEVKTPCSSLGCFRIMFGILVLTLVLFRKPRVRRVGIRYRQNHVHG